MTRQEAAKALEQGKRIRHFCWGKDISDDLTTIIDNFITLDEWINFSVDNKTFDTKTGWLILNETHQEALERLQLKVGDRVKVLEKAESGERGWENKWMEQKMDKFIGGVITVLDIDNKYGVKAHIEDDLHLYSPAYVLEKVQEEERVAPQPNTRRNPTIEELRSKSVELELNDGKKVIEYHYFEQAKPLIIYCVTDKWNVTAFSITELFIRPKTITKWYNLYKDGVAAYFDSEKEAKSNSIDGSSVYLETKSITFEI